TLAPRAGGAAGVGRGRRDRGDVRVGDRARLCAPRAQLHQPEHDPRIRPPLLRDRTAEGGVYRRARTPHRVGPSRAGRPSAHVFSRRGRGAVRGAVRGRLRSVRAHLIAGGSMDRRAFLESSALTAAAAAFERLAPLAAAEPPMIGIQVGAVSFVDEGTDKVLDGFREMAAINTIFLATFTYGRGIAGRQPRGNLLPDNGKPVD